MPDETDGLEPEPDEVEAPNGNGDDATPMVTKPRPLRLGKPIAIDADPMNANWTKQTWDLGIDNVDDLRAWLERPGGLTVEAFKKLPVYLLNVNKPGMEWLKGL